jgi:hypothetical protein
MGLGAYTQIFFIFSFLRCQQSCHIKSVKKIKKQKSRWIRETPNGANPVTLLLSRENPVMLLRDAKPLGFPCNTF